jgi:signal recognition particle GTPase
MAEEKKGFFQQLKEGLFKTHEGLISKIDQLIVGKKKIDDNLLAELEEILITSDIGVKSTQGLLGNLASQVQRKELEDADLLKKNLKSKFFTSSATRRSQSTSRQPARLLSWLSASMAREKQRPSARWPENLKIRGKPFSWWRQIPSGQQPSNNWKLGASG